MRATHAAAALLTLACGFLVFGISSLPRGLAVAGTEGAQIQRGEITIPTEGLTPDHAAINLALQLLHSEVVIFNVPAEPAEPFTIHTALMAIDEGAPLTIELWPHSVRSQEFRVLAQVEGGDLVEVDPGLERTYRGVIVEVPGASVAGSLLDTGFTGSILLPDGGDLWIEPLAAHLAEGQSEPGAHVVYASQDAVGDPGVCGATNQLLAPAAHEGGEDEGGVASVVCVKIAIDADWQYYQKQGNSVPNVVNQVTNIVNTSNNQYGSQVGINHLITEIIVRTSQADNPYTTNNPQNLLAQFRSVWNTAPEWFIDRNVAHLFTGRNLNGGVIGIAYLNSMCDKQWAYGISMELNAAFHWKTDLFAHEVGHNWNASHCSCPTTTMNPSITGTNTFIGPGSNSVNQINAKKNNVSWCTTNCDPDPPANNTCQNAILVPTGNTSFTTQGATTNGPSEPQCNFPNSDQIESDVWFRHIATCTGTLHVRLCNSPNPFDTKLAVYGINCPSGSGTAIACNKDHCGILSQVSIPVVEGQGLRIRIGGHNGVQGDGVLTLVCVADPEPPSCPADLTGDGSVGVGDLLELLAQWGPCPGCPADLTGDGTVGVADLLELLSQWGPCPD